MKTRLNSTNRTFRHIAAVLLTAFALIPLGGAAWRGAPHAVNGATSHKQNQNRGFRPQTCAERIIVSGVMRVIERWI
jgi:hypothetical protein